MKKLLWLDDMRNPYNANNQNKSLWIKTYAPEYYDKNLVYWVKNYDEFVNWIQVNGLPDMICFDHDLGEGESGYDCAKWLVDYCIDNDLKLPDWNIQSSNPVGKLNIDGIFKSFIKHYEKD